eukprot:1550788-Pyramimonas_sp.AAC.1
MYRRRPRGQPLAWPRPDAGSPARRDPGRPAAPSAQEVARQEGQGLLARFAREAPLCNALRFAGRPRP